MLTALTISRYNLTITIDKRSTPHKGTVLEVKRPDTGPVGLKRSLSLPLITFYGLGTILGAGIYVLIGEVAGNAGFYTPIAFLLASLLAAFSAFSYAELSARFPVSAGEAVYAYEAFGLRGLSLAIGLGLVAIGIVSTATLVNGFVGYFQLFFAVPDALIIVVFVIVLGLIAAWGISQAAWVAVVTTLIEIGGLLLVLWAGRNGLAEFPARAGEFIPGAGAGLWAGILAGSFLAFYAYIGFEDMANVVEEVKNPRRNLPAAILLALGIATLLYMLVSVTAVLVVNPADLAQSKAPLALVYETGSRQAPVFISLISLAAVINGSLIQIIMGTRILYGMSQQGWLSPWFARIHPKTQTPLRSTVLVTSVVLIMALWLPLVTLAKTTSFITLMVFAVINISLWTIKGRDPHPEGVPIYPRWLSLAGFVACLSFLILQLG